MSFDVMKLLGGESDHRRNSRSPQAGSLNPANSTQIVKPGPISPEKCENVLASGATWDGKLTVESSVRIDGAFAGEIVSKSTVHVADGAHVNAKIQAEYVAIEGDFSGELNGEQGTTLLPHSRVRGDVNTKVLIVKEGAVFDGRIHMAITGTEPTTASPEATTVTVAPAAATREEKQPILVAPAI